MNSAPDLVILGNLIVDDVVAEDGATRPGQPGGATIYCALGASLWGCSVGLVSWRGDDYPEAALQALAARGVDLAGVGALGRPGGRSWLRYRNGGRTIEPRAGRPGHLEISPTVEEIPDPYLGARHFHVAPMPFVAQHTIVDRLARLPGAQVSLDPNMPLRDDTLDGWQLLLRQVDRFFIGLDELQLTSIDLEWPRPFAAAVGGRLQQVIAKRGSAGGLVYDVATDSFTRWSAAPWPVVDPTGAGDSFAGGVLSGVLAGLPLVESLRRGVVSASFALVDHGVAGLLAATPAQAQARLSELGDAA